jgi:hypothetical protein
MESPLVYAIRSFPWQVFAHLTFKTLPTKTAAEKMTNAFVRSACRLSHTHYDAHCSLLRGEFGEIGNRFHEHVMIGHLKPPVDTTAFRMALRSVWAGPFSESGDISTIKWGICQVWPYVPTLEGVAYVMKGVERYSHPGEAQSYEVCKFGLTDRVTMSVGLLQRVQTRKRDIGPQTFETPRPVEPDTSQVWSDTTAQIGWLRKLTESQCVGEQSA